MSLHRASGERAVLRHSPFYLCLRAMTALSPDEAGLWFELGEVETRAGNLSAAIAAFESAREVETDARLKLRLAEVISSLRRRLN